MAGVERTYNTGFMEIVAEAPVVEEIIDGDVYFKKSQNISKSRAYLNGWPPLHRTLALHLYSLINGLVK